MKHILLTIAASAGLFTLLAGIPKTASASGAQACACQDCGCAHGDQKDNPKNCECMKKNVSCNCADAKKDNDKVKSAQKAFSAKPAVGTKAVCPVMGGEFTVTKDTQFSQYNGKYYAFCCPGCKPRFDKDPAEFTK